MKTTAIILNQLDNCWPFNEGPLKSFKIIREQIALSPLHPSRFLLKYLKWTLRSHCSPSLSWTEIQRLYILFIKILFPKSQEIKELYSDKSVLMLPVNYLRFICRRAKEGITSPKDYH